MEEQKLTKAIELLRRSIRIQDDLTISKMGDNPSEKEWVEACGITVLQLHRLVHDGK